MAPKGSNFASATASKSNPPTQDLKQVPFLYLDSCFRFLRLCRANYRQLPISSKKLTPVARLVRKMRVQDALYQCDLLQRKGALIVQNALRSARANGVHNQGLDGSNLVIEECFATNGRDLKRVKIHGRGRAGIMHRRRTHLTVILREDSEMKLRPHVVQPTWMQRELDRSSDSKRRSPRKDASKDGVVKTPRMKWRKMLRLQRVRKQAERKAARIGRIRKPTKDVTPQLTDYLKNKL